MNTAKENILKRIRAALVHTTPLPFTDAEGHATVLHRDQEDFAVTFAQKFTELQGRFTYCTDQEDLLAKLRSLIEKEQWGLVYCVESPFREMLSLIQIEPSTDLPGCDVSITGCEYLIARTGSILMSSAQASGRTTSAYAPIHICIGHTAQLVADLKEAFPLIKTTYQSRLPSMITVATGPSRTADIEKTLVTGVHGPGVVYCFLLES
ncbi:MAG: lactate utilization protein C [Ferruginibacter sp.]